MILTSKYKCAVPSYQSIEYLLVQSVALMVGAKIEYQVVKDTTTFLEQTTINALNGLTAVCKARGWQGAVRLLATLLTPAQDSWLEATHQTLVPILTGEKKELVFKGAVLDFVGRLEKHLKASAATSLAEGGLSLADVCVVQVLCGTLQMFGINEVPEKTLAWITATLTKMSSLLPYASIPGWRMFGLQRADVWKDWLASLQRGADIVVSDPTAAAVDDVPTPAHETTPTPATITTSSDADNSILNKLKELGAAFETYSHTLCMTAEELVTKVPVPEGDSHTKNLFLRDKKHGNFLVTLHPETKCNTKDLGIMLGLKGKTNLRIADVAVLDEKLHVKPGCVGPLCMCLADLSLDEKERVTLVLDQALLSVNTIHSHALRNDASVKMTPAVLRDVLAKLGVEPKILQFSSQEDEAVDSKPLLSPDKGASKKKPSAETGTSNKKITTKGETLLALQWKKTDNFPMWYSDVIVLSEMISYYDISGCYILRPWSYKIWELIQDWFNKEIQKLGVENAYFPMFVSKDRLEKEKDHVEGFAPEVAWVTKSGDGDLAKPIAIRPTSETIMYPAYADWIQSHRDLPLKLNQWSNVVRWEFKYPTPFLRTREFLWQEGHTAHSSTEEANEMVMAALDLYRQVYEDLLAVPVVPGYKTEKEKFAGGYKTTTVEAYISGSGRAIQGATSHHLGQNFGKMFDITFQNKEGKTEIVWQTSWGLTTRTIGVMVMVHGDDTGLVLPPRVAPLQVVIVPIFSKKFTPEDAEPYCQALLEQFLAIGIRSKYDDRSMYNPGWKFNHWEQKGVPIRVEVGPRDVENGSALVVIRHSGDRQDMKIDGLGESIKTLLGEIHIAMFAKAKETRDAHIVRVTEWKDFVPALEQNNLVLTPWCGGEYTEWEETVKERSRAESLQARGEDVEDEKTATSVAAKSLCIPFNQPTQLPDGTTKCIISGLEAKCWIMWGRSY